MKTPINLKKFWAVPTLKDDPGTSNNLIKIESLNDQD